jgi:hypothetical protein
MSNDYTLEQLEADINNDDMSLEEFMEKWTPMFESIRLPSDFYRKLTSMENLQEALYERNKT